MDPDLVASSEASWSGFTVCVGFLRINPGSAGTKVYINIFSFLHYC